MAKSSRPTDRSASRRSTRPVFTIPAPAGPRVTGRIPFSSASTTFKPAAGAVLDEEVGAFTRRVEDPGRPASRGAGGSRVTAAQIEQARLRQRGERLEPEEEGEGGSESENESGSEDRIEVEWPVNAGDDGGAHERALAADRAIELQKLQNDDARRSQIDTRFVPPSRAVAATRGITASDGTVLSPSILGLVARVPAVEDTDRLWDWIRQDGTLGTAFLGYPIRTSYALHGFMQAILAAESQNVALIRALHYNEHHLGFAMLSPILAPENTALMHLYLRPDMRGKLHEMIAALVELASLAAPGVHLAVYPADDAQTKLYAKLLLPLGFATHVMLIR